MSKVRLCVGNYAKTPYEVTHTGLKLYSIEELCYYLCRDAVLFDEELITGGMIDWIGKELGLEELSRDLASMHRGGAQADRLVQRINAECRYYDSEKIRKVVSDIRENAALDSGEKRKRRIDRLAKTGKYKAALREYRSLLSAAEGKDTALTAAIYTEMGRIEAQMFYFSLAEEYFEKAYRLTYQKEALHGYVCAVRMHGTREEQEMKLAASPQIKAAAEQADEEIRALRDAWSGSEAYAGLKELEQLKENGSQARYYAEVDRLVSELKEAYRKQCE